MSPDPLPNIDALPALPPRDRDAHKGRFGKLLIVATSPGMTGAGVLSARAALRSGAGLVTLAVPAGLMPIVGAQLTSAMSRALPETANGGLAASAADPVIAHLGDVLAIGPGLGREAETGACVRAVLAGAPVPAVVDADALFHVAEDLGCLRREAPTILTPHAGEMARLCGTTAEAVGADRVGVAAGFAAEHGVIVVLKGADTVITDGRATYVNDTGNPGMATGGTGDVLTGIVAALVAQVGVFEAARLGVYLHGLAGDQVARRVGEVCLVADDLIGELPAAFADAEHSHGRLGF